MKKKAVCTALAAIGALLLTLCVLASHPIILHEAGMPQSHLQAIESQCRGVYSQTVPLVPVYVSVGSFSAEGADYTIHYFPVGTVGMSYREGDGYSIEKPLR